MKLFSVGHPDHGFCLALDHNKSYVKSQTKCHPTVPTPADLPQKKREVFRLPQLTEHKQTLNNFFWYKYIFTPNYFNHNHVIINRHHSGFVVGYKTFFL